MDLSPHQVDEIQEIEKQIGQENGPQLLSQKEEKNKSVLLNLLAALGISISATAAVMLLMVIPFNKKKIVEQPVVTTTTLQVASAPNVVVQTEYVNPFSTTAQYDNPFTASQNPFSSLTQ